LSLLPTYEFAKELDKLIQKYLGECTPNDLVGVLTFTTFKVMVATLEVGKDAAKGGGNLGK